MARLDPAEARRAHATPGRERVQRPAAGQWEVRGRRVGIVVTSPLSTHQAFLFRQLTDAVTVFRHTGPEPDAQTLTRFAALGIRLVETPVSHLRATEGTLHAVVLTDGTEVPVDAVTVSPRFVARTELYEQLGGTPAPHPMGGAVITTEPTGRTDVPGVWAAGNVGDLAAMVSVATGAGVMAGAAVNADLVAEDTARAVAAHAPAHA
ncbi:FAD-dependent oxidoreductase [Actinocorallia sp. API 0066]|uniref:FAD-dependent oxidoreductase n=1 Tax=Actinocorallia sp. API 0066 TaxID=2896846 RepID=UPI001E2D8704|nr:FAD-dependent oxidoreductase [Actinocorallia sp. API 0066]MCD0449146.1 FAD-dependent oxidoreductase [Actinocorallia sp. API 0066]